MQRHTRRKREEAHSSLSFQQQTAQLSDLCEEILDMCCARTVEKFGRNACDNMTIIIIVFDFVSVKSELLGYRV